MTTTSIDLALLGAGLAPVRIVSPHSPLSALAGEAAPSVPAGTTIADAMALMEERGAPALLVDGGAGLVTERMVASALAAGRAVPTDAVESIAGALPVAVDGSTTVAAAAGTMVDERVTLLVVVAGDGTRLVHVEDLLEVLADAAGHHPWVPSLRTLFDPVPETWLG